MQSESTSDLDPFVIPLLDLRAQHRAIKAELIQVFSEALETANFVGGSQVTSFESDFRTYVSSQHAVGVGSGTDALRFALMAMGVGPGHRVITVPNTFIATTGAISQTGAVFEFVDVDPQTCLIDPNRLEDLLRRCFSQEGTKDRPTALIPVHLYGQTADMDAIMALAVRYDLKVLEDAAQAHGASYKGRRAGSFGHVAAFSFYPAKNLGACGEGGAVTTDDPVIAESVRIIRDHGRSTKYYHKVEGYNGRLDSIQASILRVKLRHLDDWNASRRKIAARYDSAFQNQDWLHPVKVLPDNVSSYHLYVVHADERDSLRKHLGRHGIQTGLHYPLPLHLQECYLHRGYANGDFPHAERSAETCLSLPIFPEMTDDQVEMVINAIQEFGDRR